MDKVTEADRRGLEVEVQRRLCSKSCEDIAEPPCWQCFPDTWLTEPCSENCREEAIRFAARIAALEEAVEVADDEGATEWDSCCKAVCENIATAIRALIKEG